MNTAVLEIMRMAAVRAGADLYTPEEWDGDSASAYAMVRRVNRRQVITVNADDVVYALQSGSGDVYAYAYRSGTDVTDTDAARAAVAGTDVPHGEGSVRVVATDSMLEVANAIVAAMGQSSDEAEPEAMATFDTVSGVTSFGLTGHRRNWKGQIMAAYPTVIHLTIEKSGRVRAMNHTRKPFTLGFVRVIGEA